MSERSKQPQGHEPPSWAVEEARDELFDVEDPKAVQERAGEIAAEREEERHDEYDDPDQGGEG